MTDIEVVLIRATVYIGLVLAATTFGIQAVRAVL